MSTAVLHVRLWDRREAESTTFGFGKGLFLNVYETLEPCLYRQTLYIADDMSICTTHMFTDFGYYSKFKADGTLRNVSKWIYFLRIYHALESAVVAHNVRDLYVNYKEALGVIDELKALGYRSEGKTSKFSLT